MDKSHSATPPGSLSDCPMCDGKGEVAVTPGQPGDGPMECPRCHGTGRRLPDDAPNRWVDATCHYCKPGEPCLMHDRRPRTLAQNRVIFGPSFGYEPTAADHEEAGL